jgi:hypothetical protein
MRIRIVRKPGVQSIDGIRLDRFEPGYRYEVGNSLGALLLAEGWAVPEPLEAPAEAVPMTERRRRDVRPPPDPANPPNLIRELYPPYFERLPSAADRSRRKK